MRVLGSRERKLAPPPAVVREALVEPRRPAGRPWLTLVGDEVEPRVLEDGHERVVWASLWPGRPDDVVALDLRPHGQGTALRFTWLSPGEEPEAGELGHIRRRLNELLFRDLLTSYGQ